MHITDYINKYKYLFLFVVLIAYFFISAFLSTRFSQHIFGIFFSITMLFSLMVLTDAKRPLIIAGILLTTSTFIIYSTGIAFHYSPLYIVSLCATLIFLMIITSVSLYSTYTYTAVDQFTLYGAVCTYLLMGLTWTEAYLILYHLDANAFSIPITSITDAKLQQTFNYYSFVTLSTLGYGDILPISAPARMLAWMEAIMGQAYLTILIAQIVGQYIVRKKG